MYSGSGPPQPEWRLPPPTTTAATTATTTSGSVPSVPPPPMPPPGSFIPSYNPNVFGPMPGPPPVATGLDTTAWGVRFNHQQHQAYSPPPPLPPRPDATSPVPTRVQSPPTPNKPLPATPTYGNQIGSEQHHNGSPQMAGPVPPPPPPLPPVYQSQLQQHKDEMWQQAPPPYAPGSGHSQSATQYTSQSPSPAERPVPQAPPAITTNFDTAAPTANQDPVPPPVPPKTSSNVFPTNVSAMGPISPSDWEHLGPTAADIDDTEVFSPKKTPAPPASTVDARPSVTATSNVTSYPYVPAATPPQIVSPSVQVSQYENQPGLQKSTAASPNSSHSEQETHNPPAPTRVGTTDSTHSSATGTTEKIDGVIEAWTRPLSPGRHSASSSRPSSIPRKPSPINVSTPKLEAGPSSSTGSTGTTPDSSRPTVIDPYGDLDPWFTSSLARYVAMLRKEAVADSDEERYKLFTAFTVKETKLREILYGIEPESKSESTTQQSQQPTPSPQQPEQRSTEEQSAQEQSTENADHERTPVESGLIPIESEEDFPGSAYDGDDLEDGQYSPGGRPIIPRVHTPSTPQRPATQPLGHAATRLTDTGGHLGAGDLRSTSVPPSMNKTLGPLATNPPQPIYTPFRYSEGPQRGSDGLAFDRPANEAYSDLRQASAESGRVMSNAPNSSTPTRISTPAQNQHDETFIGLIREKSLTYKNRKPHKTSSPPPLPPSLRQGRPLGPIVDLRSMVSSAPSKQSESSWHVTTREALEPYSDDFSYIQKSINEWEESAKMRRQKLDKERLFRQEDSETHVDSLFNGKEIGYADINVLEEEFRQAEARVQLDEERKELEDFINRVFDPLDERMKSEISGLRSHYDSALSQLDHENSRIKDSSTDKYNLSHTMKAVNDIYRMLEMRYQRRLNIALDRERRRKKTERRPLVFMGDSPALKKLDADFDQMEKRNIFEAAKDRDERANRLMDSFDDAILHGLGENQCLLDDLSGKLKNIDPSHLDSSGLSDSDIEQILKSASTLADSLRKDSESILHNFGIADTTLNNADYRVSVAEARYCNAEHDVFSRLASAKKKEDTKIQYELESKLHSIRDGPVGIIRKINELFKALGKETVPEPPTPSSDGITAANLPVDAALAGPARPPTAAISSRNTNVNTNTSASAHAEDNPDHQQRIRRALEDAKKRNAAKAQGAMAMS